jgi:signal transduction histidine kinase
MSCVTLFVFCSNDLFRLYVAILGVTKDEIIKQEELRSSKDSFLRTMSHELRTPLFGLLGTLSTILEDHSITSSPPSQGELLPVDPTHTLLTAHSRPQSPYRDVLSHDSLQDTVHALRRDDASGLLAELGVRTNDPLMQLDEHEITSRDTPRSAYRRRNSVELRQMESCTRSLLSVVNNMITYYKIDMAVAPIAMPVQLRTLLKEVCGYFESCVADGVVFTHEVKDIVPQTAVSDANLMRHVLANLVSNALRFTSKGSVTVVIDVVEPPPSIGMHTYKCWNAWC